MVVGGYLLEAALALAVVVVGVSMEPASTCGDGLAMPDTPTDTEPWRCKAYVQNADGRCTFRARYECAKRNGGSVKLCGTHLDQWTNPAWDMVASFNEIPSKTKRRTSVYSPASGSETKEA